MFHSGITKGKTPHDELDEAAKIEQDKIEQDKIERAKMSIDKQMYLYEVFHHKCKILCFTFSPRIYLNENGKLIRLKEVDLNISNINNSKFISYRIEGDGIHDRYCDHNGIILPIANSFFISKFSNWVYRRNKNKEFFLKQDTIKNKEFKAICDFCIKSKQ